MKARQTADALTVGISAGMEATHEVILVLAQRVLAQKPYQEEEVLNTAKSLIDRDRNRRPIKERLLKQFRGTHVPLWKTT